MQPKMIFFFDLEFPLIIQYYFFELQSIFIFVRQILIYF